jgi:hypothetical protein
MACATVLRIFVAGTGLGSRPSFFDTERNVLILRHMQVLHISLISTLSFGKEERRSDPTGDSRSSAAAFVG